MFWQVSLKYHKNGMDMCCYSSYYLCWYTSRFHLKPSWSSRKGIPAWDSPLSGEGLRQARCFCQSVWSIYRSQVHVYRFGPWRALLRFLRLSDNGPPHPGPPLSNFLHLPPNPNLRTASLYCIRDYCSTMMEAIFLSKCRMTFSIHSF